MFCSHYTVHAVPVYRGPSSPRSAPYTPTFPYSQLLTKSVSSHDSMEDLHPLPFLVGKYQHSALPNKLHFSSPLWRKAFKPSTHYAFVVVAYSKTKASARDSIIITKILLSCRMELSSSIHLVNPVTQSLSVSTHCTSLLVCVL